MHEEEQTEKAENIVTSLRHEISETQKRREKLNTLKLSFVTGLLGIGSLKSEDKGITTYQLLYLAPFAAVCFDLLILGEHFSIRRIGYFFKTECDDKGEKAWQNFVANNRDKFFMYGANGFTILTFIAAIYMLSQSQKSITTPEIVWFLIVFISFVFVARRGRRTLDRFDEKKRKKQLHEN
jgi:hypothetical protein